MITFDVCAPLLRTILYIWSLVNTILYMFYILRIYYQQRKSRKTLLHILILGIYETFKHFLVINSRIVSLGGSYNTIGKMPVVAIAGILLIISCIAIYGIYKNLQWRKTHISDISYRESLDKVPVGICCFYGKGRTILMNSLMDSLCQRITGSTLNNGLLFKQQVTSGNVQKDITVLHSGEEPILLLPNGKIYVFQWYEFLMHGQLVTEMYATDITEEYQMHLELESKNIELEKMNARLVAYGENINQLIREKEILEAHRSIHDTMNRVLLTTQHCLEDEVSADEKQQMFKLWEENVLLLCKQDTRKNASYEDLYDAAKAIGMKLDIQGDMPENNNIVHLLYLVISESLINAKKHANASIVYVTISNNTIEIYDDGKHSTTNIREGGGISGIRKAVQEYGGSLYVQINPQFKLIISLEKEGE